MAPLIALQDWHNGTGAHADAASDIFRKLRKTAFENSATLIDSVQASGWPVSNGKAPTKNSNDDCYNNTQLTEGEALMRGSVQELAAIGINGVVHATASAERFWHYFCAANFRALIIMRRVRYRRKVFLKKSAASDSN